MDNREKYVNNILVDKELLRYDKFNVQNTIKVYGIIKKDKFSKLEKSTA